MKKKLTALALVVVMVAMLFTGLTMAYFTDNETVTNTFTVGDIEIEVTEPKYEGGEDGVLENIVPGEEYPKDPTITNTGKNDAYVRMLVTIPLNVFQIIADKGVADLGDVFLGYDENKWNKADEPIVDMVNNTVTYIYNYADKLTPEASATLFTAFKLPGALTEADLERVTEFSIVVKGEAIQADGFEATETLTARQVALNTLSGLSNAGKVEN